MTRRVQYFSLFLIVLLTLVVIPPVVFAQPPVTSAAEIDYPPFSIVTAEGQVDGFSVELLSAALKAMGRDVSFRTGPWPEVRALLEKGEIQALPLVGRTPEREALFDFTFPYMSLHGAIVVRDDNSAIHKLEDLRGRRVGVMKGDNAEEFLRREDRGITLLTTTTFEEALQALNRGDFDAVVMQRLVALRLIPGTGLRNLRVVDRPIEDFRQDFSFAVKEGDRATLALLNEGLALVIADGTYQRLHAKWFAALQLPTRQRLIVGGDANFPPYEYLDSRGNPSGFITELTRAVAHETGLDVEIRLGRWDTVLQQLETGEIDIIQGIFYSPERDWVFDFGASHLVTHYVSVVRRGEIAAPNSYEELIGLRIIAQRGDVIVEELQTRALTELLTLVDSHEDALRELAQGKQDCALVARIPALSLIEKNAWTGLQLGRESLLERKYAYSVKNGQQALLAKLSEGMKILQTNGEYRRIQDKWLEHYQEPPHTLGVALRYSAIVLIPLIIMLSLIMLWSWLLRRQVARQLSQIRESTTRLRVITDAAQDTILMMDPHGKIIFCNPAIRRLIGYEPQEILGRDLHALFNSEFSQEVDQRVITANGADPDTEIMKVFELKTLHKDGHEVSVELSRATVFFEDGRHAVAIIRDISERKAVDVVLQQKNKEMEQFVNIVSHDLKSPLVTVKSFLGMLQQDIAENNAEQIDKDIAYIQGAADKMERLLAALLRLSRVGRMDNQPATVTVKALIDDCLGTLAGSIQTQQIDIVTDDFPLQLHGDLLQLGQIWQNLIENAIKYRGNQPHLRIEVGVRDQADEPVFYVRDNGMGIEPEHSWRIFGLFAQLNPGSDGSGLGLALVKKIVELHQGKIWLESKGKGHGCCFCFTLPSAIRRILPGSDDKENAES
jgi:two-component system sensor histidine kinase EvgS